MTQVPLQPGAYPPRPYEHVPSYLATATPPRPPLARRRRLRLRLARRWPWAGEITAAVTRLQALHAAQNDVRAMSGSEISARYIELGGEANATASTRRRGAPSAQGAPELPLDPEFVDDLADAPVDSLSGQLARVWAPFIVIGV